MEKDIRSLSRYNESTGNTEMFYPATTTDAVADRTRQKSLADVLGDLENNSGAYDISAANNNTKYADLSAALGTNGANVPAAVRKGGMSIKFVQSSDNKYVQYRYMLSDVSTAVTFTNVRNWQGVDEEPISGSQNLIKSKGVAKGDNNIYVQTIGLTCVIGNIANYNGFKRIADIDIPAGIKFKFRLTASSGTIGRFILLSNDGTEMANRLKDYCELDTWYTITPSYDIFSIGYSEFNSPTATNVEIEIIYLSALSETVATNTSNILSLISSVTTNTNNIKQNTLTIAKDLLGKSTYNLGTVNYNTTYKTRKLFDVAIKAGDTYKFRVTGSGSIGRFRVFNYGTDTIIQDFCALGTWYEKTAGSDIESIGYQTYNDPNATNVVFEFDYSGGTQHELDELEEDVVKYQQDTNTTINILINTDRDLFKQPVNLVNPNTVHDGYYVNYQNGAIYANATYHATDYVEVEPAKNYYLSKSGVQIAWYDINKKYISGVAFCSSIETAPANARYLRASFQYSSEYNYIIAQSDSAVSYVPYSGKYIKEEYTNLNLLPTRLESMAGPNSNYVTSESMGNGDSLSLPSFPRHIKRGQCISFYAKITSFSQINIGQGYQAYRGRWIEIDSTNVVMKYYENSATVVDSAAHGLTFDEYIKVVINVTPDSVLHLYIKTLNGEYNYSHGYCNEMNGTPFVSSVSSTLTDVKFSENNSFLKKMVWAFGDSYMGFDSARVMGQMQNLGYADCFLCTAVAGAPSFVMYNEFERMIAFGAPKYIVWCLGMNDGTLEAFTPCFDKLKAICNEKNIELIACTIPTVPERDKESITQYVRESGMRYIDYYAAVGANAQGEWYEGYLSSDEVHPSGAGAKALASQWLVDFNEVISYK